MPKAAPETATSVKGHWLMRKRLLSRLDDGMAKKLCLVTAPAGYGKTVLLEQWCDTLRRRKISASLIKLGDADNEPFSFLASIFNVLAEFGVPLENILSPHGGLFQGASPQTSIKYLANILTKTQQEIVFIFDGFEKIKDPKVLFQVQQLLHYFPENIHFVIGCREIPDIRLSEYKVSNNIALITHEDLRFTAEDIRLLLDETQYPKIGKDVIDTLYQKTEGWVVAVEIALNWMKDKPDGFSAIKTFSGRTVDLADYLLEQVLAEQEEEVKTVLMRMALLERCNGELVNLLCDREDGWDILDKLCRRNLVLAVDDERTWFRINSLFSEFLRGYLARREGAREKHYHLKASKWFFENACYPEALQHAQLAGDFAGVAAMLEEMGGWRLIFDGRFELLNKYFDQLPEAVREHYPRLRLAEIFMLLKDGQIAHGEKRYSELQAQLESEKSDDALLVSEAKIVRAYLSGYGDQQQTPEYLASLKQLKISLPPSDRLLLGDIENNLTFAHYELGNFGEAADSARRAISCYRATKSLYGEIFIYIHLGMAYYSQGRLRDAKATWNEGYVMAGENYGDDSDIAALLAVHLAMVAYEMNSISEAKALIEKSIDQLEVSDCWCNVYIVGYLTAARINRIVGGAESALKILERAVGTARARDLPRLETVANIQKVTVFALTGALEKARKLAEEIGLSELYQVGVATRTIRESAGIALARLLFIQGDYQQAITVLEQLAEDMQAIGHYIKLVEVLVIKAMSQYLLENIPQALATIDAALSLVMFEGNIRVFLNEGVYMHNLLGLAQRHFAFQHSNDPKAEYLAMLLKAFKQQEQGGQDTVTDQRLTHRENELALLLLQGMLNKQIAARLSISENTVKYHLKQLYKKLGVNSRKDAIRSISENKLIGY